MKPKSSPTLSEPSFAQRLRHRWVIKPCIKNSTSSTQRPTSSLTILFSPFAFLLFLPAFANSQVIISLLFGKALNTDKIEFGLAAGFNYSDLSGIEAKYKPGLNLALYFNFKMSEDFFLHVEASPKFVLGAKDIAPYPIGDENLDTLLSTSKIKRQVKYMALPILARYRIKDHWFAELGPQVNMRLKVTDQFETEVNDQDLRYDNKIKDEFTLFEVALTGGIEYKLQRDKGVGIALRYYYGFTDVMKNTPEANHNSAFQFLVSIPIGAGKPTTEPK